MLNFYYPHSNDEYFTLFKVILNKKNYTAQIRNHKLLIE